MSPDVPRSALSLCGRHRADCTRCGPAPKGRNGVRLWTANSRRETRRGDTTLERPLERSGRGRKASPVGAGGRSQRVTVRFLLGTLDRWGVGVKKDRRLLARGRPGEMVALGPVAPQPPQPGQLIGRLHPFGGHSVP